MDQHAFQRLLPLVVLLLGCLRLAHCETWAVIASSSRFWLNYRHTANALGIYNSIRRLGVPDTRIVLMLADCTACDPRNSFPGTVYASRAGPNLHPPTAEIDYRNRDVSVESVLHVLTGHHPPGTPPSRRLDSGRNSSVLLFLTGHGGDGFLKLHDQTELLATDVAAAVRAMHAAGRYRQLLIVADTCQAATLYSELAGTPGWVGVASSKLGQSSYALRSDMGVGAHLVDEFSHHISNFLDALPAPGAGARGGKDPSLADMIAAVRTQRMSSEIDVDASQFGRPLSEVGVMEFFGEREAEEGGSSDSGGGGGGGGEWTPVSAAGIEAAGGSRLSDEDMEEGLRELRAPQDLRATLLSAWPR